MTEQVLWREKMPSPSRDGGFAIQRRGIMRVGLPQTKEQNSPTSVGENHTRRMKDTFVQQQSFSEWTENLFKKSAKMHPDIALSYEYTTEEVTREKANVSTHQIYDMVLQKKSQSELQKEGNTSPERKTESKEQRLERLAMDLIRQHSVAGDPEGLKGAVEVAFQETLRSVAEEKTDKPLFVRLHDVDGTLSLMIATSKESFEKPTTLFIGHLDVVAGSNGKNQFIPEIKEVEENGITKKYLEGRGSVDMKGADTAMIDAVSRDRPDSTQLLLTTTEETGSNDDTAFLARNIDPDIVIVPDGARGGTYVTKAKGFLFTNLRVDGESAHGGRPWDGQDASLPILDAWHAFSQLPYFNPTEPTNGTTLIAGDGKFGKNRNYLENPNNSLPAFGRLKLDLRYIDEKARRDFEKMVHEMWTKIKANPRYAGLTFYDPLFPAEGRIFDTHADDPRVQLFVKQCAENGKMLEAAIEEGNTDARFFGTEEKPIPAIVIRMDGTKIHSHNEMAQLDSIFFFRDRFAQLAQSLADEKKKVA